MGGRRHGVRPRDPTALLPGRCRQVGSNSVRRAVRLRAVLGLLALLSLISLPGALVWELGKASLSTAWRGRHPAEQVVIDNPPIPIVAATAEPQDVPIYL